MHWHSLSEKEVLARLETTEEGLTRETAFLKLKEYGFNQIREVRKIKPIKIFLSQFASVLIYILIIAAIISAFLSHWIDFGVIFAIVILNAAIGFAQQYKAEKAIQQLRKMLVQKVKVLRNRKLLEISALDLVPGDIMVLHSGDKIAGDARLLLAEELQANEAVLTGESLPVDKKTGKLKEKVELVNRSNMLYAGTTIARGNCTAVVVATGMNTEFGKIAHALQEIKPEPTPFQRKLDIFSKQIGFVILGLAIIISFFGILAGLDKLQMFLTGVALAVSAIPEGLPAIIALGLALATRRMLKVNTLIRKLPAAEALGSVTTICVDKTGTITAEEMTVTYLYAGNQLLDYEQKAKIHEIKEMDELLKIGALCNNARIEKEDKETIILGDPTEKALVLAAESFNIDKKTLTNQNPRVKEYPFSSARKMMTIVRKSKKTGDLTSYVKGAPNVILEKCAGELINGKVKTLTTKRRKELAEEHEKMAKKALRVLAFAYKPLPKYINQDTAENKLIFVGFQGMLDPPRPEVRSSIEQCKAAGIKTIMITGDSALTAKAIADQVGLSGKVLTAFDIDELSDKELDSAVKENEIFARVSPEHKLKIIESLKRNKEIVAVTGDGVNDVLALKRADIGVAMGIRGTDVARDVSDIVLLDDNFASIVKAVHEGRKTYSNTKKFTKFLLACNFSEMGLVLYSIFVGLPLPLLPLQILWINLITDSMPALALGVEPEDGGSESISQKDKEGNKEKGILKGMFTFLIVAGIFAFAACLAIFYWEYFLGSPIEKIRTMVLTTSIIFQMFFVFTCRSDRSLLKIGFFTNKWLIGAVALAVVLQLFLIYSPLSIAFNVVPLNIMDWAKIIVFSATGLVAFETAKLIKKKS